jgi:putative oxidoreductase
MLITLSVAFFYVHGGHVSEGELAFVYMMLLFFLLVMGAGRFSLDHYLFKRRYREHPTLHE